MKLWFFLKNISIHDLHNLSEKLLFLKEKELANKIKTQSIFLALESKTDYIGRCLLQTNKIESLKILAEYMIIKRKIFLSFLKSLIYPSFLLTILLIVFIIKKYSIIFFIINIGLFIIYFLILQLIIAVLFKKFLIVKITELYLEQKISSIIFKKILNHFKINFLLCVSKSKNLHDLIFKITNEVFINMEILKEIINVRFNNIAQQLNNINQVFYIISLFNVFFIICLMVYKNYQSYLNLLC